MNCSVIVCTHNRAKYLENCLQKLAAQNYPSDKLEILVIDNNSSDDTSACVKQIKNNYPFTLNYHLEIPLGLSYARNAGLRHAKGEIIIYIDDDALPETNNWIKNIVAAYEEDADLAAAGGEILAIWPNDGNAPNSIAKLLYGPLSISPQKIIVDTAASPRHLPWGANISFRKSTLTGFGLSFDSNLGRSGDQILSGEESLLSLELIKRKKKVLHLSEARVLHHIQKERLSSEWFLKHALSQGISEAYIEAKVFSNLRILCSSIKRLIIFFIAGALLTLFSSRLSDKHKLLFLYLRRKHAKFLQKIIWHFSHKILDGFLLPKLRSLKIALRPPTLNRLDKNDIPLDKKELRVFIKVKNEGKRLTYFFKYYENLGVDRFFVIDNDSSDQTYDICIKKNNVHYFKTGEKFSKQLCWLDFLLKHYGKNHWCLFVDADEFILFFEQERTSLKTLCDELQSKGYACMPFLLLDIYSNSTVLDNILAEGENPLEKSCFFDSTLPGKREDGQWQGGMRKRVFNLSPDLTKYPLLFCSSKVSFMRGLHRVFGAKIAYSRGVILHTKYNTDVVMNSQNESIRSAYYQKGIEYRRYADVFAKNNTLNLFCKNSVKLIDSQQLLDLGFIQK